MPLLEFPEPYAFELSTARYRAFGTDLANLWHDGGLHRVVDGREVRITEAPGGVDVDPLSGQGLCVLPDYLNGFRNRNHLFVLFCGPKTERPVLDRPLKVGGGIQPRLVTVLTPATTFTVGEDFSQNFFRVNRCFAVICCFYDFRNTLKFC